MVRVLMTLLMFAGVMMAKPIIAVSIPMQKEFVEKITKGEYEVITLVKPGVNPHDFEPKFSDVKSVNQAKAYFSIGIEFEEQWLTRFANQNKAMKIYPSNVGVEVINFGNMEDHDEYDEYGHDLYDNHNEEEDSHHSHENGDTHIWLSLSNAKIIAGNIYKGLKAINPKGNYEANYQALIKDIENLDKKLKQTLKGLPKNQKFVVFHPMLGYFAKEYGLEEISIEVEGKTPTIKDMMKVVEIIKKENLKIIFAQPEFSTKAAEFIAKESGAKLGYFSPLETPWDKNLLDFAKKLKELYEK
ncbi:metal ABC transporter solute-binding protein, Zn/Mn family [Helicobacter apodemus]|uniref:ABC transporter n=1 Tax=Helicobacter apodemus TaxID=135569 RepID=A0A2U8FGG7_9HELI|nr:zinc ABC transporter substrate-binding protein [Helicobacter apodemus]AWI34887.1 ABC transporter [Helicobacter apodemus]